MILEGGEGVLMTPGKEWGSGDLTIPNQVLLECNLLEVTINAQSVTAIEVNEIHVSGNEIHNFLTCTYSSS